MRQALLLSLCCRFKHLMWTSHRQKLGEMRGKASNVDWAAREASQEFRRLGKVSSNAAQLLTPIEQAT